MNAPQPAAITKALTIRQRSTRRLVNFLLMCALLRGESFSIQMRMGSVQRGPKMLSRAQSKVPSPSSFAERIGDLLEHVEYRRMETEADLDAVLRLRYQAYLKEGAVSPSELGKLEDAFDEVDNVYNFGIFIDGKLASALRLHRLCHARQKSPALETFGDVLVPRVQDCKLIIDPNRFVANYELARLYPELPYVTLKPAYLACVHFGIDLVTITVRLEHQAFYRRGLFAYPVCPPRPYPLLSKPISLLLVDFVRDADRILHRHPYWAASESEREALFGKGPTSMCLRSNAVTVASAPAFGEAIRRATAGPSLRPLTASPSIAAVR